MMNDLAHNLCCTQKADRCIHLLLEYKKAPAAKMPAKNNDPTISVRVPPDPLPEPEGSSFR